MKLDARDYPDLASAIADARDGDSLYVPGIPDVKDVPGQDFYTAPMGGWKITRSIEIYGDGAGHYQGRGGTAFVPFGSDEEVFVIEPPGPSGEIRSVYLHDFSIRSGLPNAARNGRHGISCATGTNRRIRSLRLERVLIHLLKGNAFHLEGANANDGYVGAVAMTGCLASLCDDHCLVLKNALEARIAFSYMSGGDLGGAECSNSGAALYTVSFEANCSSPSATQGQLLLEDCHLVVLDTGRFENFNPFDNQGLQTTACSLNGCKGAVFIGGNELVQAYKPESPTEDSTGFTVSATCKVAAIFPNHFTRVHPKIVELLSGATDCTVFQQFNHLGGQFLDPGVVELPGSPNEGLLAAPLVIREAGAPDRTGFIIPSFTAPPAGVIRDGMIYYDTTDNRLRVRVSGAWKSVVTS